MTLGRVSQHSHSLSLSSPAQAGRLSDSKRIDYVVNAFGSNESVLSNGFKFALLVHSIASLSLSSGGMFWLPSASGRAMHDVRQHRSECV